MTRKTLTWLAVAFGSAFIVVVPALLMLMRMGLIRFHERDATIAPFILGAAALLGLFVLFLLISVGIYVYHDARERGMDPLLWTLVAVFVPYLIGFIVYLIVRQSRRVACPSCSLRVVEAARFCPSCGHPLKATCPSCEKPVEGGARFCPSCGSSLDQPPSADQPVVAEGVSE